MSLGTESPPLAGACIWTGELTILASAGFDLYTHREETIFTCLHSQPVRKINAQLLRSRGCWTQLPQYHRGWMGSQRSPQKDANLFLMFPLKNEGVGSRALKSHRSFPLLHSQRHFTLKWARRNHIHTGSEGLAGRSRTRGCVLSAVPRASRENTNGRMLRPACRCRCTCTHAQNHSCLQGVSGSFLLCRGDSPCY